MKRFILLSATLVLVFYGCDESAISSDRPEEFQDGWTDGGKDGEMRDGQGSGDASVSWIGACRVRVEALVWEDGGQIPRSTVIEYERDQAGLLLAEVYDIHDDGQVDLRVQHQYDRTGRLARLIAQRLEGIDSIDIEYDQAGRISKSVSPDSSSVWTRTWSYDATSRLIDTRNVEAESGLGYQHFYRYDAAGRLVEEEILADRVVDPNDEIYRRIYYEYLPDGQGFQMTRNDRDGVVQQYAFTCEDGLVQTFAFYGGLTSGDDLVEAEDGQFRYNEHHRLVAVDGVFRSWRYTYDDLGYLLTATRLDHHARDEEGSVVEERLYDYACRPANARRAERPNVDRRFLPALRRQLGWLGDMPPFYTVEELYASCEPY